MSGIMIGMDDISKQPGVKSRPVSTQLCVDPSARNHLLIAERPGLNAVLRVLDPLERSGTPIEIFWLGKVPEELIDRVTIHAFDDMTMLIDAMQKRFAHSGMGIRLYFAGRETFVWEASLPARFAGLREDEIQREACDSNVRRVFCVHCRHLLVEVTTDLIHCPNCGLLLEVRDHFSRMLAAYLGVCANAECSGGTPEPLERFA